MKKLFFLIPVLGSLVLSGCGNDPMEANADNFKAALEKHYSEVGCISKTFSKRKLEALNETGWPFRLTSPAYLLDDRLDELVGSGLIKFEEKELIEDVQVGKRTYQRKTKVRDYDLTEKGKEYLKSGSKYSFCEFDFEVQKIIDWAPPAMPQTDNEEFIVEFTAKPVNVRPWISKSEDLDSRELRRIVYLTDEGWVVLKSDYELDPK